METRKVQQVGGGTFTISLPVHWATEHGVEAGATAYLYTHRDGSLVVRWNEKRESELAATTVDLCSAAPSVADRTLTAAYTAGFKRITLRRPDGITAEQRRAILARTRNLTGVEVAEEAEDQITVQGLLNATDVSIQQSALQLQFIALSMHEAAMGVVRGETAESGHIVTRDDEADRVFRLIERHFNRSLLELSELDQLGTTRVRLFEWYLTARQLERVADHAVKIALTGQRTEYSPPEDLSAELSTLGENARRVVETASEEVINGSATAKAHAALDQRQQVVEEARQIEETLVDRTPAAAYVLTRVLDSLVRTANYGGNVAEIALRRSV